MFARKVMFQIKPNTLKDFTQTFDKDVIPMLRKQAGFRDEITFANENNTDVIAFSLWDTKEQANAYATATYPAVLKALDKFLVAPPNVQVVNVIHSTPHKINTPATVAAA